MVVFLRSLLIGIVFSFYLFPVEFAFLPEINTKMILALAGLFILGMQWLKQRCMTTDKGAFIVSVWAAVFSLLCYFSVTYNNTADYVYVNYIVKMWVWLSGAYAVLALIRTIHGNVSIQLVFHYMAWVCAVQAVLGIAIDNIPELKAIVDEYFLQDYEYLRKTKRLYGIGAAFDTAGIRFSCGLLGLGYLLAHHPSRYWMYWYLILFLIIVIGGNFMSRTTSIGMVLSMLYMFNTKFSFNSVISVSAIRIWFVSLGLLIAVSLFLYYGYYHIPFMRHHLQYGFEAFFNFFSTGDFSSSSTDRLSQMVVWPDNLKTWLIGDGWYDNPDNPGSYYKYTDIGYIRFIFYCGTIGLSTFVLFFVYCTLNLIHKWNEDKTLFIYILLLALLVWIKVTTDIFCLYALLILLNQQENTIQKQLFNYSHDDTQSNPLLLAQ